MIRSRNVKVDNMDQKPDEQDGSVKWLSPSPAPLVSLHHEDGPVADRLHGEAVLQQVKVLVNTPG